MDQPRRVTYAEKECILEKSMRPMILSGCV
jgi:hypothetical protein